MKKVLKTFINVIFVLIGLSALVTVFFFIQSKGDITKVPSIFGYKPLTILSNSMKPTFNAGDVVVINVNKVPHVNEVITYMHPQGMLVTHRLIGKAYKSGKTFYLTKGDNNNATDGIFVPRASIIGVEEFVIPNVGYFTNFMTGPVGFFIFIVAPLLAILIIEIFKRLGIIENKKELNTKIGKTIEE